MVTKICLYMEQVGGLEKELLKLRKGIHQLREKLAKGLTDENKVEVKLGLDLILGDFRILKEQAGTLVKMGDQYDLMKLLEETFQILFRKDPSICMEVMLELDQFVQQQKKKTDRNPSLRV